MTVEHERKHKKPKLSNKNTRTISQFTISPPHPLNVKPAGNELLQFETKKRLSKKAQMGHLCLLPDELIMDLLGFIENPVDLLNLSHTSRVLYAYIYDEEIWRKLYTKKFLEEEKICIDKNIPQPDHPLGLCSWKGSWRKTLLNIPADVQEANLENENLIFSDILYRPFQCSQINYEKLFDKIIKEEKISYETGKSNDLIGRIQRIDESVMTVENFNGNWINTPFILTKKNDTRWPSWDLDYLLGRFSHIKFRQEAVRWTLSFYADYFENNRDESPLYLFDCDSKAMSELAKEYKVPECFDSDLFKVFQEEGTSSDSINCRPNHSWLIVGPKRSGSTFHKDPNQTSAWNVAITGRKLWIMLPPDAQPPGVGTDAEESEVTSPVGIAEWVLSGFFNDAVRLSETGDCIIGITHPGENMYVPSGWWHSVINIDDAVAITQNFSPLSRLPNILNFLKNKSNQISGFRPKEVKLSLEVLINRLRNSPEANESLKIFNNYLEALENAQVQEHLDEEDCGETLSKGEVLTMPIYEMFKELLILAGYGKEIEKANAELVKLESVNNRKNFNSGSLEEHTKVSKWEKLTESTKGDEPAFSFGFEESDDE